MSGRKGKAIHRTIGTLGVDITLQDIMDGLEDELLVIDDKYLIRFANSAARRSLQEGAESPIGKCCYEVLHGRDKPCGPPLWDCPLTKVLKSGSATTLIHRQRTSDEDIISGRYVTITAYPIRDSYGNIDAIVELRKDITAQRELETQILRRYHELLALARISAAVSEWQDLDAILSVALDNMLELVNGTIGGILLLDEESGTLSYHVHRGLSGKYASEMRLTLGEGIAGKVAQTGQPILLEDISKDPRTARPDLVSKEGLKAFVSVPLRAKYNVLGVMNVASHLGRRFTTDDMHVLNSIGDQVGTAIEQARLYERLHRARERYRMLLQHALTAQEEERKRIARELHDETSQSLTGLALNLRAATEMVEMGIANAEIAASLKKAHFLAVQTGTEISKLINDLRPTLLDALGLVPAIRQYAETNLEPRGINVSLESKGIDERLPSEVEVGLFRVAQGAISNIARHSDAKNATISLERSASEVVLRVEDDGKGFDVGEITGVDESGRGAGLFGMKERVNLVGGTCAIESQPGQGTKVVVRVPRIGGVADEEDKSAGSG